MSVIEFASWTTRSTLPFRCRSSSASRKKFLTGSGVERKVIDMKTPYKKASKHLCTACGRFIKWALALCWDCNVKLRETGGTQLIAGEHIYPVYNNAVQ